MTRGLAKLLGVLLLVLGMGASPAVWAGLCSSVWMPGTDGSGLNAKVKKEQLNLPTFLGGEELTAKSPRSVSVGDSHWKGGQSDKDWELTAPSTGTARVFVDGNLQLKKDAKLNAGGDPKNLVLILTGNLEVEKDAVINAFIYVLGNVIVKKDATIKGAVSADGNLEFKEGLSATYVEPLGVDFGSLCDNPTPPPTNTCFGDDFNRSELGASDWAVTSRSGSFGVPKIVSSRLRLTNNTANVATGATVQRLFPASANFVQVQFKYYAYNGSGADGVAVVFSDAAQTPQPGAYGGSLGYAQGHGNSGFAGGWLGIALDEYGNFSNPSEGREGGPGRRSDSVSVRGSGSGMTGYSYLAGTGANLGIDMPPPPTSTPGPGHTYRITLDSTVAGKAMLKVERDSGLGFVTLISSFDVLASTGQAALPTDLYLTLTGSTGGSNNIHELDDLQVCATKMNMIGQQIDHYEFVHAGNALTCNPLSVEVRACLNADCSLRYTSPVTATLTPSGWEGGNSKTFSGGVVVDNLRVTTAQTVTLGVGSSSPPLKALGQTLCKVGSGALTSNCNVTFADSGFVFDVPNLLAAKEQTNIALQAVRKDNVSQKCVPAFGPATRTLQFWSDYVAPAAGTMPVRVNDTAVSGNSASPTSLSLTFDSQATTQLKVRYDDAGSMQLNARFVGTGQESGLEMTGSDPFVSRPYGLHISSPSDSSCATASVAGCSVLRMAGDSFPLSIRAVAWQSDSEARTEVALRDNPTTPNFALNGIALNSTLLEPSIPSDDRTDRFYRHAADGTRLAALTSYDHALGDSTTLQVGQREVGIYRITASPPAGIYHGQTVDGGTSALIGRFTPARLGATASASLTPACGGLSYQGQVIDFASGQPQLVVTGYNRQGEVTKYYDRDLFWRLSAPQRQSYSLIDSASKPNLAARLSSLGNAQSLVIADSGGADGSRAFDWRADTPTGRQADALLWTLPSPPTAEDLPFGAGGAAFARLTLPAAQLTDADNICYRGASGGAASCQNFSHDFGGSEVRVGRLRIGNAHGSELQGLSLPLLVESWRDTAGGSFQVETMDTCTVLGGASLDEFTGSLAMGETSPTTIEPLAGVGSLLLSAPGAGNDGSVRVVFPAMPEWLEFDWDGKPDTNPEAATGRATFGIYRGPAPLIFRRELYRQ